MKNLPPKKVRMIVWCLLGVGGVTGVWGAWMEMKLVFLLGIAVMLSSLAVHLIFYRCPHCGGFLDRSTGDFCPRCGKRMDE